MLSPYDLGAIKFPELSQKLKLYMQDKGVIYIYLHECIVLRLSDLDIGFNDGGFSHHLSSGVDVTIVSPESTSDDQLLHLWQGMKRLNRNSLQINQCE